MTDYKKEHLVPPCTANYKAFKSKKCICCFLAPQGLSYSVNLVATSRQMDSPALKNVVNQNDVGLVGKLGSTAPFPNLTSFNNQRRETAAYLGTSIVFSELYKSAEKKNESLSDQNALISSGKQKSRERFSQHETSSFNHPHSDHTQISYTFLKRKARVE